MNLRIDKSPLRDRNLHDLERLESRLALDAAVGDALLTASSTTAVVVANDAGARSTPLVRVLDPVTGALRVQFLAYEPSFRGGVRVSTGDVTGDGIEEIVVGPGAGRVGEIRVFTQAGVELPAYRTRPFGNAFTGGVEVAAGVVTGPGQVAIVAAQGARGNLVRVFTVTPGAVDPVANVHTRQFQPFGPRFMGGVRLATADFGTFTGNVLESESRDGVFEIVASSGAGIRATVAVQNAATAIPTRIAAFNPLATSFNRGVFVARLPGTGDAADRVIVSGGPVSRSQVETWSYAPTTTAGRAFVRGAAFAAFHNSPAAVVAAALDESNIFTAQNLGGTTPGVRRNTAATGGTQTTLPSSICIIAPQRITVVRPPQTAGVVTLTTEFNASTDGWIADAADLPSNPDVDYELDWGLRPLPAEVGAGNGFMLQGTNRSDDLFLYLTRQLNAADGILPNTSYQLAFEITLASNAPSGSTGIGGSPAESVFLKAGGSSVEPQKVLDRYNNVRLSVDKGNQGQGGKAATVAGNIANGLPPGESGVPAPYASIVRQVTHTANVTSDAQGRLWLLAGIDSGFEGFTRIYLQKIEVRLTKA